MPSWRAGPAAPASSGAGSISSNGTNSWACGRPPCAPPFAPNPIRKQGDTAMYSLAQKPRPRLDGGATGNRRGLRDRLLALPRFHKRLLQVSADVVLIWASLWLAFYLRLDDPGAAR